MKDTSSHRVLKKNHRTEIFVNDSQLPLNHFMQETVANMIIGILKTFKEAESPKTIEIKITKLTEPMDVDAHTYP